LWDSINDEAGFINNACSLTAVIEVEYLRFSTSPLTLAFWRKKRYHRLQYGKAVSWSDDSGKGASIEVKSPETKKP
jgi:hypothetical protein